MFIHEATEKALRENCFICRKSAKKENMSVFGIIKPTNTYDTCLLLIVKNGKIDKGSGWWNPTADDLMADDWEVLRDKSSYNLDKPKEREKAPRHVPENLIYHDRLSGREVNQIIEEIMAILIKQKITTITAKQILEDTIKAIDSETTLGERMIQGEIIRAGQ